MCCWPREKYDFAHTSVFPLAKGTCSSHSPLDHSCSLGEKAQPRVYSSADTKGDFYYLALGM